MKDVYVLHFNNNSDYQIVRQEIAQLPGIQVGGTRNHIGRYGSGSLGSILIDTTKHEVKVYTIGENYLDLMQVDVKSGRPFHAGNQSDENAILVNSEFAKSYYEGKDPINEVIKLNGERKTIVGVVNNFIDDVYEDAEMTPFILKKGSEDEMIQLLIAGEKSKLASLEPEFRSIWSDHIDLPYTGQLQEDFALGSAASDSENLQKIFLVMALLGGFLSLVGIFSLAKLNVAKKFKEMSIRKVLGATLKDLFIGVNKTFLIILLFAVFIGSLLGYLVADNALSMIYKYHVDVSPLTSVLCALFIVLFSVVMISVAVFSPAKANPVVGLRDE